MNPRFSFLLVCCLSLFWSCDTGDWLTQKDFGETSSWEVDDALDFSYDNVNAANKTLVLDLAFSAEYPYQNIWFKLLITDPQGQQSEVIFGDTLMDVAGVWLDQTDVGSTVDWQIQPQPTLELTQNGKYQFSLKQHMREESLEGVQSIKLGLR
ncbi:MAG: hypothetical protein AB8H47_28660 [Bacteroidia bacterium]